MLPRLPVAFPRSPVSTKEPNKILASVIVIVPANGMKCITYHNHVVRQKIVITIKIEPGDCVAALIPLDMSLALRYRLL